MSLKQAVETAISGKCVAHVYALLTEDEKLVDGKVKTEPCLGWLVGNLGNEYIRSQISRGKRLLIWVPSRDNRRYWSFNEEEENDYYSWLLHESEYKDFFLTKDWKRQGLQLSLDLPVNLIMLLATLARLPYEWENMERQRCICKYKYKYGLTWEQAIVMGYAILEDCILLGNSEQGLINPLIADEKRISDFIHRNFIREKNMSVPLSSVPSLEENVLFKGIGVQKQFKGGHKDFATKLMEAIGKNEKGDAFKKNSLYYPQSLDLAREGASAYLKTL